MAGPLKQSTRYARTARGHGQTAAGWIRTATTNAGAWPQWARANAVGLAVESAVRAAHWAGLTLDERLTEKRNK